MSRSQMKAPEVKHQKGRVPEKGTTKAHYPPNALMHHPERTMGHRNPPKDGKSR